MKGVLKLKLHTSNQLVLRGRHRNETISFLPLNKIRVLVGVSISLAYKLEGIKEEYTNWISEYIARLHLYLSRISEILKGYKEF